MTTPSGSGTHGVGAASGQLGVVALDVGVVASCVGVLVRQRVLVLREADHVRQLLLPPLELQRLLVVRNREAKVTNKNTCALKTRDQSERR